MNKHLIVLGIAVLLLCTVLSGCTDENSNKGAESRFLGKWKHSFSAHVDIIFSPNGSCSVMGGDDSWELKDGKLYLYGIYFYT